MKVRTVCAWTMTLTAAGLLSVPLGALGQSGIQKSLFVSVTDKSGNAVKDMAADDFHIREDGSDRRIVMVKHASQPIRVEVLVDTAQPSSGVSDYLQPLREAVANFGKKLLRQSPDAKVALMEFGQAAVPDVRLTTDPIAFEKGVNALVIKPGVGSVLLEALVAANDDLAGQQDSTRRAIVSINMDPMNEQSTQQPKEVVDAFRKSGAQLWAVSVQTGGLKNKNRGVNLDDFTKASGGQRDTVLSIQALDALLQRYADALTYEYEIVYERPEGKKPPKQVQVGNSRPDGPWTLHASGFPPQ